MDIINLTAHFINIIMDRETLNIPPSGNIARCEVDNKFDGIYRYNGINIRAYKKKYGKAYMIDGEGNEFRFPHKIDGIYYIVSLPVAMALQRSDIFIPGELVRDDAGTVVGCKGLNKV